MRKRCEGGNKNTIMKDDPFKVVESGKSIWRKNSNTIARNTSRKLVIVCEKRKEEIKEIKGRGL